MAKSTLYKLVNDAQKNNTSNKVRLGYTANDYDGVVGALEKAYYQIRRIQQQGGGSVVSPAGTFNASTGLSAGQQYSTMSSSGNLAIKVEAGGNWTSQYQGRCLARSYMSFYVNVSGQSKYRHVPVGDADTKNAFYYGESFLGDGSYPAIDIETGRTNHLERDDYVVGVGLDFNNFVIPYLKRFFNEDGGKWEINTLREVGQKLQMFAEILFPKKSLKYTAQSNGEESSSGAGTYQADYHVLHCPITVDCQVDGMKFNILWFPVPLIFINQFSALGTVSMEKIDEAEEGKRVTVGKDGITVPFSSSKYQHKQAKIPGFNYSTFKNVDDAIFTDVGITYFGAEDYNTISFVRIFFDKAAESALELSSSLTQQQRQNLFQGAYAESQFVTRSVVSTSNDYSIDGVQDYLNDLMNQLNNKFPINQMMNAILSIGLFQAGSKKADNLTVDWGKFEDIGDGQGVSAGALQFTQAAGGLAKFASCYRARVANIPANVDAMLKEFSTKTGSGNEIYNSSLQHKYKKLFGEIATTNQGKMAQLDVWKKQKWPKTKQAYNQYNATTAMEFFCISGGVNHLPALYQSALNKYNIKGETDLRKRCEYFQACHWQAWVNFINSPQGRAYGYLGWNKNKGGNGTAPQFLSSPKGLTYLRDGPMHKTKKYGHGQARRLYAILWNIYDGNFDLTKRLLTREKSADFPGAPWQPTTETYPMPSNAPKSPNT